MTNMQPTISAREYGILAGLAGEQSWNNPYPERIMDSDHDNWKSGRVLGEKLAEIALAVTDAETTLAQLHAIMRAKAEGHEAS